jgi:hypothetical protein
LRHHRSLFVPTPRGLCEKSAGTDMYCGIQQFYQEKNR